MANRFFNPRRTKRRWLVAVVATLALLLAGLAVGLRFLDHPKSSSVTPASKSVSQPRTKKLTGPSSTSDNPNHDIASQNADTGCYSFRVPNPVTSNATNGYCNTEITYKDTQSLSQVSAYFAEKMLNASRSYDSLAQAADGWKQSRSGSFQVVSERNLTLGDHPSLEIIETDRARGQAPRFYRTVFVDAETIYVVDDNRISGPKDHRFFLITGNNDDATGSRQAMEKILGSLTWK